MALPRKARRLGRMLSHATARTHTPRLPQKESAYIVEHTGTGYTHRASERCMICEALKHFSRA